MLVSVALVPIVCALGLRQGFRDRLGAAAVRLAAVVVVALALLAFGPSKWSYHLGAAAGLFASFLTVAVVLLVRRARTPDRYAALVGLGGTALLAAAAALAFAGPNAWWLPGLYDMPWAARPVQPGGVPLDNPLLWIAVLAAGTLTVLGLRRDRAPQIAVLSPAVITLVVFATVLAVLGGTFATAPLRRPAGSLAMINLHRVASTKVCGLADYIEVLPDGAVLTAAGPPGPSVGFAELTGFFPGAPPPDPPGVGTSAFLWGSHTAGPHVTGSVTTQWFALGPLAANQGVTVSLSGRTSGANSLEFEFGRADGTGVDALGRVAPVDRPASDEDPTHPLWRSVGVDAADVPAGADRVRIQAVDGRTDEQGWLAFTGPRLRSAIALNDFLADKGPVLVSWPMAILFPCVHDIPAVSGGVAQTPRTVIESPRPWLVDDRNAAIGGTFAGLAMFGGLSEVPSRLAGHPEVDWGSVVVSTDTAAHDTYTRTTRTETVWGFGATRDQPPER